jgi:hypothetical protein
LGRVKVNYYSPTERIVQLQHYQSLSERQQRHFLGFEYKRLGIGSQRYLSEVFACSRMRIGKGYQEIETNTLSTQCHGQRKAGGGRKKRN